jgi:hypothetical protein
MLGGLFGGLLGGGGGGSFESGGIGNSSSASDTSNMDARITAGEGSTNNSQIISGGTNTLTDHAAVAGGIKAALAGIESATRLAEQAQASSGGVLSGALKMAGEQQTQFTSALENIKTSDVRALIVTGLVVVGIVGVAIVWKRGG